MRIVIVAGHAICRDIPRCQEESSWILLDFQRGEVPCYIEHIRQGVELAAQQGALLIFAGGYSRADAGPRSEAASYYWVADHFAWWGQALQHQPLTEEFSRDSYENLLFGICRAKEFTGQYPSHVTFVSWKFKESRFGVHQQAIGLPDAMYHFHGANNPPQLDQALRAEASTHAAYLADPYSATPAFRTKRDARNPFRRQHGYAVTCPELQPLFAHQGPSLFAGPLPWRP